MKNWTGNTNSIFTTMGASNHTLEDRECNDYYATEPKATELLVRLETFNKNILEPCCGEGHIAKVLENHFYIVESSDLIDRGYGKVKNFFDIQKWKGDIITNPPYIYGVEIVQHALNIIDNKNKVCCFLKLQFLESKKRKKFFDKNPPVRIWVSSSRLVCSKNGVFGNTESKAVCYAWFIWQKGFKGISQLKWFN